MDRLSWENRVGRVAATFGSAGRGNGYVTQVSAKSEFVFDPRTTTPQDIPLAVGIDSSAWVSGVLVVRIMAKNSWSGTTPALVVRVDNIMLAPEEPDVIYAASAAVASVTIDGGTAAPSLLIANLAAPIGPMLRVRMNYSVAAVQSGQNTISLGIDLVGRPA